MEMDAFDLLRQKWADMLVGSRLDAADPDIRFGLDRLAGEAQGWRSSLARGEERRELWDDLSSGKVSAHITTAFDRLRTMAAAYAAEGSELQGDAGLLRELAEALAWLWSHRYREGSEPYGNWWDWVIGIPLRLADILTLLHGQLPPALTASFLRAIAEHSPVVDTTGANRVWKATVSAFLGMLGKDEARLEAARDGLTEVFAYVMEGDGFYEDGSFVQHEHFAYNGGYGLSLLGHVARLMVLLEGSPWQVTDPGRQHVFRWVYDSYEPFIYNGALMDMVRGREISRHYSSDHRMGHLAVQSILLLSDIAEPENRAAFRSMVKHWIGSDSCGGFYRDAELTMISAVKRLMEDETVPLFRPQHGFRLFAAMDRAVYRRPGFGLGVSLHSSRTANYEAINGENLKGWHTGSGMLYLYNADGLQFSDGFWPTVDARRLPGTTVSLLPREEAACQGAKGANSWAGGVALAGRARHPGGGGRQPENPQHQQEKGAAMAGEFGSCGMELHDPLTGLAARKSWFLLEDEIAAVGSGISGAEAADVETIVENRRIPALHRMTVDGRPMPDGSGWQEELAGVSWVHLAVGGPGREIGYYFPGKADIAAFQETRTGTWEDINRYLRKPEPVTRHYAALVLRHGRNPVDAAYRYVLLPGRSPAEVEAYAEQPAVEILEHSPRVHAVWHRGLGITGAHFWENGPCLLRRAGAGWITAVGTAAVMLRESQRELELAVSDPARQNAGRLEIEVHAAASAVLEADEGIEVLTLSPTVKLRIAMPGAAGRSFVIRLAR
ncbi:polysaccharide lyase 8 family protein [Paenibacillus sp. YN15]|uniref:polysaccharide lyase 8 family protein n=1 Tax=Paenibacillus sp. YN15 TaxID=1742774 RepID=UPI000DCD1633|nr:polysaccharide lyase 8 family protein [Paenibacillus sp. YN15]RAU99885.1 xanthan lyase [Paenibacillus sp. YN15]